MIRTFAVFGSAALLGGSMLLGTVPAQAAGCPAGMHWVGIGGAMGGSCAADTSGGVGTGSGYGNIGGSTPTYGQAPGAPAVQPALPPVYAPAAPPAAVPQVPNQAPANVPAPVRDVPIIAGPGIGTSQQAPAGGYQPGSAADMSGTATEAVPSGETLQEQTPVDGQAPVAAAPAAPTTVMPATEVQAVAALRSATATAAEKDAALVIVKARIDVVLSQALANASADH